MEIDDVGQDSYPLLMVPNAGNPPTEPENRLTQAQTVVQRPFPQWVGIGFPPSFPWAPSNPEPVALTRPPTPKANINIIAVLFAVSLIPSSFKNTAKVAAQGK